MTEKTTTSIRPSPNPGGVITPGFPMFPAAINPNNRSRAARADDEPNNFDIGIQQVQPLLAKIMAHLPMILQNQPQDAMAMLRAYLPFIPIMQLPQYNVQINSDSVNAIDIIVPTNAVLVKFGASGPFVANAQGVARVPTVPATTQVDAEQNFGAINPVDCWYYLPNTKTISVLAIGAPCIIGASFLVQV